MTTMAKSETTIEADPNLPTIRITREFDAPPEKVFRAWVEPELFARWIGPTDLNTCIEKWDASTGGHWRYTAEGEGTDDSYAFYGSFHEVRPAERLVQTFTYEGFPDQVALETMTFADLGDGRTRVVAFSVWESIEARDGMIASGMEHGVVEGYQKLDQLLSGE